MTSINFNASATTALRTLQSTNSALEMTQNRVATGLKIGEAKDNAAYWAISTTLKSDNKSLATVKDALNLGAATVDTAYQGLNKAKDVLDEIKTKLTAATQDGVDRTIIQSEINALKEQLQSIAASSTFSGENWLSVDSSVQGFNSNKSIVASFSRDGASAVTIGTVDVDIATVKLYDSSASASGILDSAKALVANGTELSYGGTAAAGAAPATQSLGATTASTGLANVAAGSAAASLGTIDRTNLHVNDRITFNVALNGAVATPVTVQVDATAASSDANLIAAINTGLTAAGLTGVTASNSGGVFTLTSAATGTGASIAVTNVAALDGNGVAIVQATGTGGLSGVTPLGSGTSTKANSGAIGFLAAATAASDVSVERLITFNFQYGNEVFTAELDEAAIALITDEATLVTQLNTAIQASTRVGDGAVFSATYANNVGTGVGYAIGIDPNNPTGTDIMLESLGSGTSAKIGISNLNSYEVNIATGIRNTANAIDFAGDIGITAFFASGTDTAAVVTSTFALGTVAAGDRITFDATLSTGPLPADQVTQSISVQTNAAWTAATFATSLQQAIDTAFGAGQIQVTNNGGVTTFTTVATGASAALAINNVLGVDGDGAAASVAGLTAGTATGTAATVATAASTLTNVAYAGTTTYDDQDSLTFDVTIDGTTTSLSVTKDTIDAALSTTDGVIASAANFVTVLNKAMEDAGIDTDATFSVAAAPNAGKILLTSSTVGLGNISVSNVAASTGASTISVADIDLTSTAFTGLDSSQKKLALSAYLSVVNDALTSVTTAAANLGAVSSRIDLQNSFVDTLIDTIDKGVSNLVDADLSEESTRLQALQTKQQLGIQALSIANSSQQNIMRLFQ
jgi:flagellin-like hook-associated protein FlgL